MLRGMALFGILVVNFPFFVSPDGGFGTYAATHFPGWIDRAAHLAIHFLLDGKFVLIFSFLFGWGLYTQMGRGAAFLPRYKLRMLGLFLIGLAHAVLLFVGDILVTYAALGFCLLAMRDWPVVSLIRAAFVFWLLSIVSHAGLGFLFLYDPGLTATEMQTLVELHRNGSFADILNNRLQELWVFWLATPFLFAQQVFGAFLTVLAVAKHVGGGNLESLKPAARIIIRWLTIPALLGNAAYAVLAVYPETLENSAMIGVLGRGLFVPLLTAVYLAAVLLILAGRPVEGIAKYLGGEGRPSLSVYVGESLLAGLVAYSYGLGLYGSIGPAAGLAVCVAIYAALIIAGALWLVVLRMGPLEWLLRSITEARFVPMLRETSARPP
jgi:uncharacterized protein